MNSTSHNRPGTAAGRFQQFLAAEASGGIVLMVVAALALVVANSPLAPAYFSMLHIDLGGMSLSHWINDGLMVLFFLVVGLEIKREVLEGELSTWPQRILPGIAAIGGMLVPALLFAIVNRGNADALRGWAIPSATDIAFALGVLALLGPRVPAALKIFLTALAIIDDLGAIVIIALFYTESLHWAALAGVGLTLAALVMLNWRDVRFLPVYLLLGVVLWVFTLKSGIHATLAGVALAFTIPLRGGAEDSRDSSPLLRLEHGLHRWVAFAVIPVFGFANAGVALTGLGFSDLAHPVTLGVLLGLFVGKQLGIFVFCALAIRMGLARMPAHTGWSQLYGVCVLCGIGFTMSLFIGSLAFANAPALTTATKLGVLAGSLLSALVGSAFLLIRPRQQA